MRIILNVLLIIVMLFSISVHSQIKNKKKYFPIWTFHKDSVSINGLSLGLWTHQESFRHTKTNGLKLELLGIGLLTLLLPNSPISKKKSEFEEFLKQPLSEQVNGINISGTGTICHCLMNGLTIGGIGQINTYVNGIAISGYINMVEKLNGLMSGVLNNAYLVNGLQIGATNITQNMRGLEIGMYNFTNLIKGIQLGVVNNSFSTTGVQIGLFNKAKKIKGIQLGLWNENPARKFPILNWNFKN